MPIARIRLKPGSLPRAIADLVRDTRATLGWSQRELAARANVSRTRLWRIEAGDPRAGDFGSLDRILGALGLAVALEVDGRHVSERREQRDPVHAALVQALAGRLERAGWRVRTEAMIGRDAPAGWIDLLGFRVEDRGLLIVEAKGDLPDVGGLQRQVAWYERAGPGVAERLGWHPRRAAVAVVCLDTESVAQTLAQHRDLLGHTCAGDPRALAAWVRDPRCRPPDRPAIVVTDLGPHRLPALEPSVLHGRRRAAAYAGYAEAAATLRCRRRVACALNRPRRPP